MIKVFTTNKDGKIELTKDELKNILDESYWDGYKAASDSFTYQTPSFNPYKWDCTTTTKVTPNSVGGGVMASGEVLNRQSSMEINK